MIPRLSTRPGLCLHPSPSGAGRVIRPEPDPSARPAEARRVYESLQGSPAVGPLATPRRCHGPPESFECRQGSPM